MKKIFLIALIAVLAVGMLACNNNNPAATSAAPSVSATTAAPGGTPAAATGEKLTLNIGMYADGADSYYQVLHDTLQACADADPACAWKVDYKVGQNTPAEQIQAVEDFITAKYDALVVIQNSPDATSECLQKTTQAGIPYFGAVHSFAGIPNATDAAGSCGFDFVQAGKYAGEDAAKRGVKKVIMIEGQLGQGTASAQSEGFLLAYEEAGKNMGGVTAKELAEKKTGAKQDGSQDITVVGWASGGWFAEPAQKAMTDYITSLGPEGFDGVYVHNDPMMEGVLSAMQAAGLDPADYWLGSCNGREMSWDWVKNKTITMDVNQSAALEGDTIYQQIKAYFTGQTYRKYVHPYLTPYNIDDISTKSLVPFSDVAQYMEQRAANQFPHDITGAEWTDMANMGGTGATASPAGTASASPTASASATAAAS
jgi:ABC-type sugar transport system substrate-binding protein